MKLVPRGLALALALGLGAGFDLGRAAPSAAPSAAPGGLRELLARAEAERQTRAAARAAWRAEALADVQASSAVLSAARSQLASAEARVGELEARFEANEVRLQSLRERLASRGGDMTALSAATRQVAGEVAAELAASPLALELPGRDPALRALADGTGLVTLDDLELLGHALLEEAARAGEVRRFPAEVVDARGTRQQLQVTRVGTFVLASQGRVLEHGPGPLDLRVLAPQPPAAHELASLDSARGAGGPVTVPLDPTRGALYGLLAQTPDWRTRVAQGGPIGMLILCLAATGFLIAIERVVVLGVVGRRMQRQRGDRAERCEDNPLGRVLAAAGDVGPDHGREVVELRLDAAILRELPALRRGVRALKLMAGVAPLLGLLGTVTGMILTFQKLTLFGAGDPRLMADGISQALVTTALGLMAAIPLLFLHRVTASRAEALAQVLEEEAAGLLAERLEAPGGTP